MMAFCFSWKMQESMTAYECHNIRLPPLEHLLPPYSSSSRFLAFSMNRNSLNFPMGSNTRNHPEEVNAQIGAQNAQTGARRASPRSAPTGSHPPLPSSIVKKTIVNGIQVHDYSFMGSWSTSSTFQIHNPTSICDSSGNNNDHTIGIRLDKNALMPSNPSPNPQNGNSGEPQFQNKGNELSPRNIDAVTGDQIGFSQVQHQEYSTLPLPETCNVPIQSGFNGNGPVPIYLSTQMEFDQPRSRQGITAPR
ncbi:hypothetical protein F0562_012369 [Nyssa sinensis]|uniref:Uncharacterized protein n=1 Tax=Nyssa sinensis TaxID=561372 RepID=A0A5J4ZX02_9ASTE|nr:hypothetical protein F0562_012369 [Nyssa sinensis]